MNACTECGSKDNYNFALNIGLCDVCIGEKLEQLQTELAKAKKRIAELEADRPKNVQGFHKR